MRGAGEYKVATQPARFVCALHPQTAAPDFFRIGNGAAVERHLRLQRRIQILRLHAQRALALQQLHADRSRAHLMLRVVEAQEIVGAGNAGAVHCIEREISPFAELMAERHTAAAVAHHQQGIVAVGDVAERVLRTAHLRVDHIVGDVQLRCTVAFGGKAQCFRLECGAGHVDV